MFKKIPKRFLKFCVVGLLGVIVNQGLLFILTEFFGLFYLFSSVIAIETAIISNFILNDFWTFRDKRKKGKRNYFSRLIKWNLARILTLIINLAFLWFLTTMGLHYLISNLIGIAAATLLAYLISFSWVWK